MRHLPYAPYIMHAIEQVSSIWFPTDSQHELLKISNKTSITAVRDLKKKADAAKGKGKGLLGSRSHHGASPPATSHSSTAKPLSSSSSGKKPNKFKFLMTYMFGQCVLVLNVSMTCKRGSIIWSSGLVLSLLLRHRLCIPVILWHSMMRLVWHMRMMMLLALMARARLLKKMRTTWRRMMMTMTTMVVIMVTKMMMRTTRTSSHFFMRPTPCGTC